MSELVEIAKYLDRETAEINRGVLEVHGIHAFVMPDDLGGMRPHVSLGANVRLLVPRHQIEEAQTLLNENHMRHGLKKAQVLQESLDSQTSTAYRCAYFGLIIPLVPNIYSIILLLMIFPHRTSLTDASSKKFYRAGIVNTVLIALTITLYVLTSSIE